MNTLQQILHYICSSQKEKSLLYLAVAAFVFLVIGETRFPVWIASPVWLSGLLTSDALKSIISAVSASVFAAYVFYVFIELIPASTKRSEMLRHLDSLLLVVLDAFNDKSLCGPTLPLSFAVPIAQKKDGGLTMEFLQDLENKLGEQDSINFLVKDLNPLEQLAEAAEFRLPALSFATQMAYSVSSTNGLLWLDIIKDLHEISLVSAETLAGMSNDERRSNLLLAAVIPRAKEWLNTR